jgi:hypothetical protein
MTMSKSIEKKNGIRNAIRASLDQLIKSGTKITQTKVIAGAVRENGTPIGKSTLYARNVKTKEFIHADLIKEIDTAIANQFKKARRKTRAETIKDVKAGKKELQAKNKALIDQIVMQQDKIKVLTLSDNREQHGLASGEDNVYIVSSVLNIITQGAVSDVRRVIAQYDDKYSGTERLKLANLNVERYLKEIDNSRLITLKQSNTPKSLSSRLNIE